MRPRCQRVMDDDAEQPRGEGGGGSGGSPQPGDAGKVEGQASGQASETLSAARFFWQS